MNRLQQAFARTRSEGRGALMPYITAGDPDPTASLAILRALQRGGADLVELGIPYSDPLADGPVIQAAAQRALQSGTKISSILTMIGDYRSGGGTLPLVIMTCYNPILAYGPERFASAFATAGADAVLVTDLPPSEAEQWGGLTAAAGLATVFLVAPTTPPERVHLATERTTGFVYAVARAGVTGTREDLPTDLAALVDNIRQATTLPVAVGFGISTPQHVRAVWQLADGAVVGSALVKVIAEHVGREELVGAVEQFVRQLRG